MELPDQPVFLCLHGYPMDADRLQKLQRLLGRSVRVVRVPLFEARELSQIKLLLEQHQPCAVEVARDGDCQYLHLVELDVQIPIFRHGRLEQVIRSPLL